MISSEKYFSSTLFKNEITLNKIYSNNIVIAQYKNGYRFNADSMILSWFISKHLNFESFYSCLEIGSGSGIIPIVLNGRGLSFQMDCVEIQESLFKLLEYNLRNNKISNAAPFHSDFSDFARNNKKKYDVIITNPPYFPAEKGKLCPDKEKACSKHEVSGNLKEFFERSFSLLSQKGSFFFVFPVSRIQYALTSAELNNLYLKRIMFFSEDHNKQPGLFAAQLIKSKPGTLTSSSIAYIRNKDGSYTTTGNEIFFESVQ